jgi:chorismate mutase
MNLSKRSIEMLLDLVEIKLSYMDISDREDARDMQVLERARSELQSLDREPETVGAVFARPIRRPGRPRTAA